MFTQLERFFSIVNVGEEGDVKEAGASTTTGW